MSTQGTPGPKSPSTVADKVAPKKTIGELVADVSQTFSALVRDEIKLAQAQLVQKFSRLGIGGAMLAVAGLLLALYAVPVLLYSAIHGLAHAVPLWLSALIIGLVLVLIAVIIALVGLSKIKASQKQDMPDPVGGLKESVGAMKKGLKK
ncbi:MAG: phage holin family protein [Bowdeniella nasicola]|nr:phage holin family protein [Bowdeniella nasicola]